MDMLVVIISAALVSILANFLKVWGFGSPRLSSYIKNSKSSHDSFLFGCQMVSSFVITHSD
jgi:hypothetical protein